MLQKIESARLSGIRSAASSNARRRPCPGLGGPCSKAWRAGFGRGLCRTRRQGIEFGSGFSAAAAYGSQNNDAFVLNGGAVETLTNNHGGFLGGITSGMP
jgi:chorismate synthase